MYALREDPVYLTDVAGRQQGRLRHDSDRVNQSVSPDESASPSDGRDVVVSSSPSEVEEISEIDPRALDFMSQRLTKAFEAALGMYPEVGRDYEKIKDYWRLVVAASLAGKHLEVAPMVLAEALSWGPDGRSPLYGKRGTRVIEGTGGPPVVIEKLPTAVNGVAQETRELVRKKTDEAPQWGLDVLEFWVPDFEQRVSVPGRGDFYVYLEGAQGHGETGRNPAVVFRDVRERIKQKDEGEQAEVIKRAMDLAEKIAEQQENGGMQQIIATMHAVHKLSQKEEGEGSAAWATIQGLLKGLGIGEAEFKQLREVNHSVDVVLLALSLATSPVVKGIDSEGNEDKKPEASEVEERRIVEVPDTGKISPEVVQAYLANTEFKWGTPGQPGWVETLRAAEASQQPRRRAGRRILWALGGAAVGGLTLAFVVPPAAGALVGAGVGYVLSEKWAKRQKQFESRGDPDARREERIMRQLLENSTITRRDGGGDVLEGSIRKGDKSLISILRGLGASVYTYRNEGGEDVIKFELPLEQLPQAEKLLELMKQSRIKALVNSVFNKYSSQLVVKEGDAVLDIELQDSEIEELRESLSKRSQEGEFDEKQFDLVDVMRNVASQLGVPASSIEKVRIQGGIKEGKVSVSMVVSKDGASHKVNVKMEISPDNGIEWYIEPKEGSSKEEREKKE